MSQPTLASIPGILARTLLRAVARILTLAAGIFLLVGLALAFASLMVATWRTPRRPRTQLLVDIAVAGTELYKLRRRRH